MAEEPTSLPATIHGSGPSWLRLQHAVRMAFDFKKMVLGALGLLLLSAGWSVLDQIFPGSSEVTPDVIEASRMAPAGALGDLIRKPWDLISSAGWRLTLPARLLAAPLMDLFVLGKGGGWSLHSFLGVLWVIAVWGIFGGAIARLALVQLARMSRIGILGAVQFSLKSWVPLVVTPLCPLVGVGLCALVCAGIGLVYRLPGLIGGILGGILFFLPLAAGLLMAILLFGLVAGWPLMHASVAAEAEDTLDALSRSFSYVNQRSGKLAGYWVLAWLVGIPGLLAVDAFVVVMTHLTTWGLSLSAPAASLAGLGFPNSADATIPQTTAAFHTFWRGLVGLLAQGWVCSYFWTAASFIYLLLRHDVDGTQWTEIKAVDRGPAQGIPAPEAVKASELASQQGSNIPSLETP
jgi:hypothetical protein